jgi:hypothetical protein
MTYYIQIADFCQMHVKTTYTNKLPNLIGTTLNFC